MNTPPQDSPLREALTHPHATPEEALHDVFVPPPDEKPREEPSTRELLCYGSAAAGPDLMSNALNGMINPILNMTLGVNPALIGLILSARGICDAFANPIMAHISDNWERGRSGRRRPFIAVGGVLKGLVFIAMWSLPHNLSEMGYIIYFGILLLIFGLVSTIFTVPYYALGIELSPTYHGRTRVVVYRSIFSKIVGFTAPWFLPFCLLPLFKDAVQGIFWLAVGIAVIGISTALLAAWKTKERTGPLPRQKEKLWTALWGTIHNIHFLKIALIYVVLLFLLGAFSIFGAYLSIYYVFGGNMLRGSFYSALVGTLGSVLALLSIPVVAWLSRRYEKHNALRISLGLMMIGALLNLVCLNPQHPWLMFIMPFFYAMGISCVFTVLSSLQADVVDVDELNSGHRREGMFGAATAYFINIAAAAAAAVSGFLLAATGFRVELAGNQSEDTFLAMRLIVSLGPAVMLGICILILRNYPLTETYIQSLRPILEQRRREAARDATVDSSSIQ